MQHAAQSRETHSLPTEWACARGIGRRHVANGHDTSRAKRMTALGLRLHEAVGVPLFQAYRAARLRVGRDRAHELRHARHALVERLLALALGWQDALALPAEVAAEGGKSKRLYRSLDISTTRLSRPSVLEDYVEGLDDAHQRATARAAQPLRRLVRTEDGETQPDATALQIVKEHFPRCHMHTLPREPLFFDDEGVFGIIHRAHLIAADERERQRFFRQILVTTAEAAEAAGANIPWSRDRSRRGSSVELDNGSLDGERVTAAAAHAIAELYATATERRWQLDRQACGRMRGNAPREGMPRPC